MSVMSSPSAQQSHRPWEVPGSNVVGFLELTDSLPVELGTAILNQQEEEHQLKLLSAHQRRNSRRAHSRRQLADPAQSRVRHGSFLNLGGSKGKSRAVSSDQISSTVSSPRVKSVDLSARVAGVGSSSEEGTFNPQRRLSSSLSSPSATVSTDLASRIAEDGRKRSSSSASVSRRLSITSLSPLRRHARDTSRSRSSSSASASASASTSSRNAEAHAPSISPSSPSVSPSPLGQHMTLLPPPVRRAHSTENLPLDLLPTKGRASDEDDHQEDDGAQQTLSGGGSSTYEGTDDGRRRDTGLAAIRLARRRTQPNLYASVQSRRGKEEDRAQAASARVLTLTADLCNNGLESTKASHLALTSTFPGLDSETLLAMLDSLDGDTALLCEWLVMKGWGQFGDE